MTFTAIDFETATSARHSACAVGIVTVELGIITDEYYTLIQPPDNFYSYHNIRVHGITSGHTANKDTFDELYPEIYKRLLHKNIVAHNESFDRNVLKNCISYYGLSSQGLSLHKNWQCTVKVSRNLGFYPNKLSDCCKRLNIPLQHHEALSDARACALLYLKLSQQEESERRILS
jgi:DNA polymerase-3 subunit epsilon